jgi:hypothetical protein
VNSPGREHRISIQTCDGAVLKIFLRMPGGCEDDLDHDNSEVPDLGSPPFPAEIISFVLREDCDKGSVVQIATIRSSRQPVD